MLRYRLLMAAAILAPVLGLLVADFRLGPPGAWLAPLALLVVVAATGELLDLMGTSEHRPIAWSAFAGSIGVFLSSLAPLLWSLRGLPYPADCPLGAHGWPWAAMAAAVGGAFVAEMLRYEAPGGVVVRIGLTTMIAGYAGLLPTFLVALRQHQDNAVGMAALVSAIWVAKWSDTGAYAIGRLFGRRKLFPKLSPGKTVAGGVGAFATGGFAAWAFFQWVYPWLVGRPAPAGSLAWIAYGLIVTLAAMLGDLAESLIKRDLGRKDSSRWMPGLGGVLDVVDSILFAAPVAYLAWLGLLGS